MVIQDRLLPPYRFSSSVAPARSSPPLAAALRRLRREGARNASRAPISSTSSIVQTTACGSSTGSPVTSTSASVVTESTSTTAASRPTSTLRTANPTVQRQASRLPRRSPFTSSAMNTRLTARPRCESERPWVSPSGP